MTPIMRIFAAGLLALSALCQADTSDNPVTAFEWQAFPYEQAPYDYAGERLNEYWFQLTVQRITPSPMQIIYQPY